MSLVREQGVGAEKWHFNTVRAASAYVCLVQIVRRQVDTYPVLEIEACLFLLIDPFIEQITNYRGCMYA